MHPFLLALHSGFRWLVIISLISSICYAYRGLVKKSIFTPFANSLRHWTATIAHMQLFIGMTLYFQSPIVKMSVAYDGNNLVSEQSFFRFIHLCLMIVAVTIITIGSAKAKRMETDREKYKTMLKWFGIVLLIIFIAIPWPFSPLATRPLLRTF